jgi:branched-chain amino acid transport system substrate-binding protein
MRRRQFVRATGAAGVAGLTGLAGCSGAVPGGGSDTFTIGVLGPKTGPLSTLWSFYEENVELAIEQINGDGNVVHDGGGIDAGGSTREVDYVAYDTESKPNVGVSAAERLVDSDGVSVMLGAMSSTTTLAIMEVSKSKQVPQITSVSVNQKITGSAWHEYMFRNKDTDTIRAKWITRAIAEEMDVDSIGMIGPNNDFGVGRMETFAGRLEERGVTTTTQQAVNPDQRSFLTELEKIRNSGAEALYLVINDPIHGELMIPEARQVGFETIVGTGPVGVPEMPEKVGDPLDDVYVEVTFPNDAQGTVDHVNSWAESLTAFTDGEVSPNYIGAPTYDAVNLVCDAAARADSTDPEPLTEAMGSPSMTGVFPYPEFTLEFRGENNQAEVVSGLGQWSADGGWSLDVRTGPFAES